MHIKSAYTRRFKEENIFSTIFINERIQFNICNHLLSRGSICRSKCPCNWTHTRAHMVICAHASHFNLTQHRSALLTLNYI